MPHKTLSVRMAVLAWLAAPTLCTACTFANLTHDVSFSARSTRPTATEILAMVHWYAGLRSTLGISEIDVYAKAAKGQRFSSAQAQERVRAIGALATTLLRGAASIPLRVGIEQVDISQPRPHGDLEKVWIGIQPLCTKTRSCCGPLPDTDATER